jgi:energy-coupling factor transporter ATP-binding protein EcfA2
MSDTTRTNASADGVQNPTGDSFPLTRIEFFDHVTETVRKHNAAKQAEITSAYQLLVKNSGNDTCFDGTTYSLVAVDKARAIHKIFCDNTLDTEVSKKFAGFGGDLDLFHAFLQTNLEEFIHSAVFTREFVSKQNADKHLEIPDILKTLISSFKAIGVVMTWEKKDDCDTINLKYGKTKYDFKELLALASRGSSVVINLSTNTVSSITRTKFFRPDEIAKNYGISSDDYIQVFAIRGYTNEYAIKWDGTNMRVWWDGTFRASTLGVRLNNGDETTTSRQEMPGEMSTYEEKALDLLMKTHPKLQKFLQTNPGMCVICELICSGTAVITIYLEESLQILYFQDESGKIVLDDETLRFASNQECVNFMINNPGLCGTIVEGTVQYIRTPSGIYPVLKHKREEYCNVKRETSNITGFSLQNPQKRRETIMTIFEEICSIGVEGVQQKYNTFHRSICDFVSECCDHFPKMIAEIQAKISEPIVPENLSPFMKAFVEKFTQLKKADSTITDFDCIKLILGSSNKADAFLQYNKLMTFLRSLSPEIVEPEVIIKQLDKLINADKIPRSFRPCAISLFTGKQRIDAGTGGISIVKANVNSLQTAKKMSFDDFYRCYYNVNGKMVKSKAPENNLLNQAIVSSACLEGLKKPQKKSDTSEPSAILAPASVPAQVSVLQKFVVLDFDETLAFNHEIKTVAVTGDKSKLYDLLDDPKSIQSSNPYETMISVVTGLKRQGYSLMILTGRKEHLKNEIRTWILTHFGIDVPEEDIICRKADTKVSTALFKAQYLAGFTSVNPAKYCAFIDDAKENLAAVKKLCPHVNLLLAKEGIMYPYAGCSFGSSNKDAKQHTIVCLCGPPGSGKTTLVTQLIAAGFMTEEQCISHDAEVLKGNDPKLAYELMQAKLKKSVAKYEVTLLDTTCPDVSQLKKKFPGVNIVVIFTFLPVTLNTDKTMKKQQLEVLNGPYNEALNSFVENVKKRSLSSDPTTSTLVYDTKTLTVVKTIFNKCLAFPKKNSDIPSITACIGSDIYKVIEELRTTIGIQTQESANPASASPASVSPASASTSPASASPAFSYTPLKGTYTGAFFDNRSISVHLEKCGMADSEDPIKKTHITFAYMPTETDLSHSGTEVTIQLGQPITENCITMFPVRFVGDHPPVASGNPHITWFVGEGKRACDAGSIKVPADHPFLDTEYKGVVMINLLG